MSGYDEAERADIRLDLENMYTAGRQDLPDRAETLASAARMMTDVIDTVNSRSAQMGDDGSLLAVLDLAIECQNGVSSSVTSVNNLAVGVIAIADDFVDRDDYAKSVYNSLEADLQTGEPGQADVPQTPNKDGTLAEGDGSEYEANPDVQDPEQEREDRDEQLDEDQDNVEFPEG